MFNIFDPAICVQPIRNWQYDIIEESLVYPVDIIDVKTQLRIDWSNEKEDNFLTGLIVAATQVAENYTRRTFINKKFRLYMDYLDFVIEMRRFPFQSLDSFKYLNTENVWTDINQDLYYTTSDQFPKIILKDNMNYPDDQIAQQQSVIVEFTAGYGEQKINVPAAIRNGILNHISFLYSNRGDSDFSGSEMSASGSDSSSLLALPNSTKLFYQQYRLYSLFSGCAYYRVRDNMF